jgi:arylsulfatase A-like enzyme
MLTGLYPHAHGLFHNVKDCSGGEEVMFAGDPDAPPLRSDAATWEEALSAAGYQCHYWGKWHTGDTHRGCYRNDTSEFRTYYRKALNARIGTARSYPGTALNWISGRPFVPDPGLTEAVRLAEADGIPLSDNNYGRELISPDHTLTAFTVDKAMEALTQSARSGEPFSVTCSIIYPHNPWIVAEPWYSLYPPGLFSPPLSYGDTLEGSPFRGKPQVASVYYPREFERGLGRFMSIYWGAVAEIDFHVGRLLTHLEDLGVADRTVVVFTSDHGEMLGSHGMIAKRTFYEEAVRVPLIVRAPDGVPGVVCDRPVGHLDMVAAFCDYCGVAEALPTQGRSLRSLVCGDRGDGWDFTFSELDDGPPAAGRQPGPRERCGSRMVRSAEWKYMLMRDGREGLYDLRRDPAELLNLLAVPVAGGVLEQRSRMRRALLEWMRSVGDPARLGFER